MRYRRVRIKGGTYFFTLNMFKNNSILTQPENIALLKSAFKNVMDNHPFKIDAMVVLPNHLHCIWSLPNNDDDYSTRWRLIKTYFSRRCDEKYKQRPYASRLRKKEQAIWHRRFWEHLIRDDTDFANHVAYIHYNPVKHKYVEAPKDWPHSSFHKYVENGLVDVEWGAGVEIKFPQRIGNE